ncbi:MAG: EAL domain-containing protein [Acidobacteriota bacterium]|nr:EAL domain-containing protein [Acidobacteriota bacterium]
MAPDPCKLLVVDDNPANRNLLLGSLAYRGYQIEIAENGEEALEKINHAHFDLVLLDQMMPGISGLDLLRLLRATYSPSQLPVIMIGAVEDSEAIVDALGQGANDFVSKPVDLPVMDARIQTHLLRSQADRESRLLDPLTGLGNRTLFLSRLEDTLSGHRPGKSVAVLLLDLDGFQNLNDNLGHHIGDQVLLEAAARFRRVITESAIHPSTLLARVGADEFAILLDAALVGQAQALAQALLSSLAKPFRLENSSISISSCAGIALCNSPQTIAAELLRDARLAMFNARQRGRNECEVFDQRLRQRAHARLAMAVDLYQALERNQMLAFYQSKVNLHSGAVLGFEALLRWHHPQLGLIQPSTFIPIAENTGLIVPLGAWILRQAGSQLNTWQTKFPGAPLSMNINVSVKQLKGFQIVGAVERVLAETGIPPESLHLELTESALIPEIDAVREVLARLRALNIRLHLDDFGTGYSSLSCLRNLHFDSLKIDRSFVQRLDLDPESRAIVETILNLARTLHMTVVAEGIETESQRALLLDMGCEEGQGFLFSKPVAAEIAEQSLACRRAA